MMSMLADLQLGFSIALSFQNLLLALLGCLIGTLIGLALLFALVLAVLLSVATRQAVSGQPPRRGRRRSCFRSRTRRCVPTAC